MNTRFGRCAFSGGPTLLSFAGLFLVGSLTSAQVIHEWLFDEANGTQLTAAVDSVGGSSWSGNLGASSIQSGALVIGGTNFGSGGSRSSAPLAPSLAGVAAAGGTLTFQINVSGWAFGTRQPQFQIGFVDAANDWVGALIVDVGSTIAFVGGISDTGTDLPSSLDLELPKTLSNPYVFQVALDYTALEYTVSYSTNGGIVFADIGTRSLGVATDVPVAVSILARFTQTDTQMLVDSITVIPEPSTYAAILGLGALGLIIRRRLRRG